MIHCSLSTRFYVKVVKSVGTLSHVIVSHHTKSVKDWISPLPRIMTEKTPAGRPLWKDNDCQ